MPGAIDHIGILVEDLDEAVARWSAATGYTFSPVGRYRTENYVDSSAAGPHTHDARFVISREGTPRIELLEATGEGTHSTAHLGVHHLALVGNDDLEAVREHVSGQGIGIEGENTDAAGNLLLFFTESRDLGAALEFVSSRPGPIVRDDGSPAALDPVTGRPSILA